MLSLRIAYGQDQGQPSLATPWYRLELGSGQDANAIKYYAICQKMSAFKLPVFTAQCTTTEYFDMQILSTANERGVLPGRECA